jgi:Na+/melibiose symporter-like transporter
MGLSPSAVKEPAPAKLKARELLTWSASGFSNTMNFMALSFLTIYCTDMLGLNAALVGTLLLASRILDGITDVFAGYIVDKTNTKLGRGRPYEFCMIGVWACTVLLFSCPVGWEVPVKCAWILTMYAFVNSIFKTLLAAGTTPYMVRAFNNQQKYVSLTSYGGLISMLGAVVINVAFPIMMGSLATSPQGWTTMILIVAIPGIVLGMLRFFFVKEKYDVDVKTEKINFNDVLTVLKTTK